VCVAVFFWQLSLGQAGNSAVFSFGVIPAVLFDDKSLPVGLDILPTWATIFTSMFLHGGWMHLISNMLYLWIFGNNVEDSMGHRRYIFFYLVCGVAAVMAHALVNTDSEIPMIGASGAISGVLGAYLLLYPHARVVVMVPVGVILITHTVAAYWVLGFWFVLQVFNSFVNAGQQGGVAFGAHIGGFVAGMILIPFFKYKNVSLFAPIRSR
jgi:membrane associated rhomboid family serine protease